MGFQLNFETLEIGQIACGALILLSFISGLILFILILAKVRPSINKRIICMLLIIYTICCTYSFIRECSYLICLKQTAIRIPKLMTLFLYFTSWILMIAIPSTSFLFCFVDYKSPKTIDNYIAAHLFTISMIPLIITHLARFLLLRIQHGISNATMSFNLGQITWNEFLDNPEIILQEDYDITNPNTTRKYTIYICLILISISSITIILTNPYNAIWIISVALGIVSMMTSIIVWIKSKNFDIKSRLDSYGILKEMNQTTIVLLIQFISFVSFVLLLFNKKKK